jgi:hypothetical protein
MNVTCLVFVFMLTSPGIGDTHMHSLEGPGSPSRGNISAGGSSIELNAKDLPGWEISTPERYSANQLYGYINGGAEIYLEYGFRKVTGQRCTREKHELQIDIYEMVNPEAAFGMFSTLRGRCGTALPGTQWNCVTPEQILFAKGAYLISIVPYDRAAETRSAAMKAAKVLVGRIKGAEFRTPPTFRAAPLSTSQRSLRYVHGPLALQSVLNEWTAWLDGIDRFDMYHTVVGDGGRRTEAATISFKSKRDVERFLRQCSTPGDMEKDGWRVDAKRSLAIREKSGQMLYVLLGPQMTALRSTWK